MKLSELNEAFDRAYKIEEEKISLSEQRKEILREASQEMVSLANDLFRTWKDLREDGISGIKEIEIAFQNAIERNFPDKEWWEVTDCNIFWSLFNGQDPELTITEILRDMKPEYKITVSESVEDEDDDISDEEYQAEMEAHIKRIPKMSDKELIKDYKDFRNPTHDDDKRIFDIIKAEMRKRKMFGKKAEEYKKHLKEGIHRESLDMTSDMEKYLRGLMRDGVKLTPLTAMNKVARQFPQASEEDVKKVVNKVGLRESKRR